MTQLQLQNLIKNSLGPLVDAAIRVYPQEPMSLTEWLALKAQLDATTIDQGTFDAAVATMLSKWTMPKRLAFHIALARHNGDLPAAATTGEGDKSWPDSDWATIVTA